MFEETANGKTQYCPMCEEWADKCERIKELAQQGYDMYVQSRDLPDYERMAEWMKNQFMFILSELEGE